ncbi:MAG: tryptophan halogenase family protein [Lysobacteraceae bacterium]
MTAMRNVLIVGGGTAGWLAACYLAKTVNAAAPGAIAITLVESAEIPSIGVGEGSFPSIRGTLSAIGIDEARFLRECGATFKHGIRFDHWVRPPGSPGRDHYFHPFNLPSQRPGAPELLPYWLLGHAGDRAFAEAVTMQKRACDAGRAPKGPGDGDYRGRMNYAYHFDAGRLAALLRTHAQALGVHRVVGTVRAVVPDAEGGIDCVRTDDGELRADLYVDCTGFRATLVGEALGVPFHGVDDTLFVDRALALQVPWPAPDAPIPSTTVSTACEAGWIWDIPLQHRRGVGYVYSSRHVDDAIAERTLRRHVGPAADGVDVRALRFRCGYRRTQWVRNCVAIGLSAGFVEPLESTGIGLVEIATYLLAHLLPSDGDMAPTAARFNAAMVARYERIVDFIKLHYCLSQRRDSAFWRDNTDPASVPDTLRTLLAGWRCRPPHRLDFVTDLEMFMPASWQFILYGMEYPTDLAPMRVAYPQAEAARREFATLRSLSERAVADLPPHRAALAAIMAGARAPAVA